MRLRRTLRAAAPLPTVSSAAIWDPDNISQEVYFNSGGTLMENYHTSKWWGPVVPGGTVDGAPTALYNSLAQTVDVFYNSGGVLMENIHSAGGWTGPLAIGGTITGTPTALYNTGNDTVEVYFNSGG